MNHHSLPISSGLLPPRADTLLRLAVSLQCLGYGLASLSGSLQLGTYLFLVVDLSDQTSVMIERLLAALLVLAGLRLVKSWSLAALFLLGSLVFFEAVLTQQFAGKAHREFSLLAQAVRYGIPCLVGVGLSCQSAKPFSLFLYMRLALSCTFFAHGLEALFLHPQFIDYLIGSSRLVGIELAQGHAQGVLRLIGVIDIFLAVACLARPTFFVLGYMAFWGLVTCLVRPVYTPSMFGLQEALVRSLHWALPLVLMHGLAVFGRDAMPFLRLRWDKGLGSLSPGGQKH